MKKAIFLDRDGVINYDPGYVHKIEDFKLLPYVTKALSMLKGFELFIVTNQSGIGRGYYTKKDFLLFNDHLIKVLESEGIKIKKTYYCPHKPSDKCDCRKPSIKFLKLAEKEFNINLSESFVIGDHPHDIVMGKNAGCKAIYILTGHGEKHINELTIKPDFIAKNLVEAAKYILGVKK